MRYGTPTAFIARKYACAFINVFVDTLTMHDHDGIEAAEQFLRLHKRVLFFLTLPGLERAVKERALEIFADRFELSPSVRTLFSLLMKHNRLFLIPDILCYIIELFKEHKGIISFAINSSHELSSDNIAIIERFLAHLTGKAIIYTYAVNNELIAGIRVQSTTMLWEYSIRKHLHGVELLSR